MSVYTNRKRLALFVMLPLLIGFFAGRSGLAGAGSSGTISVTAEVVRPFGFSAVSLTDTISAYARLGEKRPPSERHLELAVWPGGTTDFSIHLQAGPTIVADQYTVEAASEDYLVLVDLADSVRIVTIIPSAQ